MILSFSKEIFLDKILSRDKVYTLRKSDRVKPGTQLQLWLHNPRNVTKNPKKIADAICEYVDHVIIDFQLDTVNIIRPDDGFNFKIIGSDNLKFFSQNDGFNSWNDFRNFFIKEQKHDPSIPLKLNRIWFTKVLPV